MFRAAETTQRTDIGRRRRGNEDSLYVRPPVFVVADGMGGARAGEVASQIAVDAFSEGLAPEGTPEQRLTEVVQRANRRIHARSQTRQENAGMGTTLIAAYLDGGHVALAHVGDSRAYLLRGGELTRLTRDHSLVEELRQRGKLTEAEAAGHPQRSIITRALGPEPEVEVDTLEVTVQADDVILLCSDGLTSMISEQDVRGVILGAPTLQQAARRLIDAANAAGGKDNISVILFRVEEVDAAAVDQPTIVSTRGGLATAERPAAAVAPAPPPERPPDVTRARPARLARTQGLTRPRPEGPRHFGRLGKTVAALVAVCAVVFLVGGGGYLASRQLYFLGTDGQGIVTVYRGFPYVLPFGVPMYETFYVSGVPAAEIPPGRRATLLDHDLHAQTSAIKLINALELGEIQG
jgi:serine/threonine protein phosphatase PrpC